MTASGSHPGFRRRLWALAFFALAAVMGTGGWWIVQWRVGVVDQTLREDLLHQATAIAQTLDLDEVRMLSFTAADREQPAFHRLREQFIAYQTLLNCRGIYTLALRDGQLVFGPESYADPDPHASSPGTVYEQPTDVARALFHTREPLVEGPVADEYGTFVSAFAPVVSPRTGEVLMIVGLDIEATGWRTALARQRCLTGLALLPVALILMGGAGLLVYRANLPPDRKLRLGLIEPCLVGTLGLTLTLLGTLAAFDHASRARRDAFQQLAQAKADRLVDAFFELRTHQLGAIARFFAGSEVVDRAEFRSFTAPIAWQSRLQALAWVRPVSAAEIAVAESEARTEGLVNHRIWQESPHGKAEPGSGRDVYYAAWYVEPMEGNESFLKFDLASSPAVRTTIEAALVSDLPTASQPVHLRPSEDSAALRLLIFHPLPAALPGTEAQDGLVMVDVRIDQFLRAALSLHAYDDKTFEADLYQLDPVHAPRFLACSSSKPTIRHSTPSPDNRASFFQSTTDAAIFPLFAFGKTYALLCRPGPAFLAAQPWRAASQTGLAGGLLTTLLTLLTAFIVRHRTDLENRVHQRTAELRESERRLSTLFGNLPGMAFRCDPDQKCTMRFVSAGALRLTGYAAADLIDNARIAYVDLVHPDDRERVWQTVQKALGRCRTFTLEYRINPAAGPEKWVWEQGSAILNSAGQLEAIEGFITDITDRIHASDQLRLQSAALEAAANAILITNRAGIIEWVNSAFTTSTGYTAAEAVGKTPGALLCSGRQDPSCYRAMWETILAGNTWRGEIINRRKDGALYTEEMSITPLKTARGDITHFIGAKQDITQRKILEDQFRQAQKMEAIGRLAGGVAHDFNNILAVILMNATLLRTDTRLSPEQTDGLNQVAVAAERGANLTRQLLSFSRRQVVQTRPLDLNDVVSGMGKMLQRIIGEDIALQTRLLPGGAPVEADTGMIEQVLLNLAVNARDAMPAGGQLSIDLGRFTLHPTEPNPHPAARPGEFIHLTVQDTGMGIAPEVLPHLFEPFFTTKDVGKGTGLGLATVHGIVDQHQGWIEVQSQPGHGATFNVYLPRFENPEAFQVERETALRIRGGGETILLVEDEPILRLLAGQALKRHGYQVLDAPTGIAALDVWRDHPAAIDLLLTDMVMPGGMSGPQLASQLQAQKPQLKVIFVSGYPGEIAGQGIELQEGLNFLQKPFDPIKLAQIVRQSLDQPSFPSQEELPAHRRSHWTAV